MKISELIGTLSEALRTHGDAEVAVQVGVDGPALIRKTVTAFNVEIPEDGEGNLVVLHGDSTVG